MNLYQSFIGDNQRSHIADVCIPHDASHNTGSEAREYELFREIHGSSHDDEPWGLISWKFELKSCIPVSVFKEFCETQLNAGHDCVFINPMIGNEALFWNVWVQGECCGHKGMMQVAQHLQQHAGISTCGFMGTESFSFCNFFVGTKIFWDAYLTFIDGAVADLEAQGKAGTAVGKIFTGSGNYDRDRSASMRIFVIERLFSSFVKTHTEIRCKSFPHLRNTYIEKFGDKLGILLHRLSIMKSHAVATDNAYLRSLWDETVKEVGVNSLTHIIFSIDDPHEIYLGEQYAKLVDHIARLELDHH